MKPHHGAFLLPSISPWGILSLSPSLSGFEKYGGGGVDSFEKNFVLLYAEEFRKVSVLWQLVYLLDGIGIVSKNLSISFSGGESSAYMTYRLLSEYGDMYDKKVVVFANTGQEHEETLRFVDRCDQELGFNVVWIEAIVSSTHGVGTGFKIVDFQSASRNGEPFEEVIKKYGIPNMSFISCTRELKQAPLKAFQKSHWNGEKCDTAIGIRADEWDRINIEKAKKERLIYPLAEWGVLKSDVNRFWAQQSFRLRLKGYEGNCKTCWKKSDLKLGTIALENPEWFDFFREMERKYEGFAPDTQPSRTLPSRFFRQHRTVDDIMKIPTLPGFVPATDDHVNTTTIIQGELFNFDNTDGGCSESCEAY